VSLLGAGDVRRLLDETGAPARRSLGQNFVADPGTVRRIVAVADLPAGSPVLEVGPGLGSLTLALLEAGHPVLAIEQDDRLAELLPHTVAERTDPGAELEIVHGDALRVDLAGLLGDRRGPWALVANLPYNVAVPILLRVLAEMPQVNRLVVMVQAEVADRLVAEPGGRTIGVPTIKAGWFASARTLLRVGPEVFVPRPRVDSAVVGLTRRPQPDADRDLAFSLVERAYHQLRKMLRSTLGGLVPAEGFAAAAVDPTDRPERLSVEDWAALARSIGDVPDPDGPDPTDPTVTTDPTDPRHGAS
jgi:16S rRNA (adenine1518-N6/adenine1519-N6)-dimethyltransferase